MTYPSLTAVGTNRTVDVTQLDRAAVFLCFAQATEHEPEPIEQAIRAQYSAAEVLVGHVIDLRSVPAMFRRIAEGVLRTEYEKALKSLPAGETAEDYVIILPDWDGRFVKALGFAEDVSKRMGVAVFGRDGTLLGTAQGEDAADVCLELVAKA